ncbi:TPA: MBL fold metallo-hydrolase [Candidatus Bathyarchaeota archaeon]|nr:MBL fold metallo-hydrolase [Candidatus Bathyarchaeota archaeon]
MPFNRYHLALIPIALLALLGAAIYLKAPFLPEQFIKGPADTLNERIVATPPQADSEDRRTLLLGFDDFIADNFPTAVTTQTEATELLEIRTRRAVEEIRTAKVPEGSMRVWYIYNMGVVVKTADATVGIDVAGSYWAPSIADVGGLLDVLIVTHPHGDHLDAKVAATAAKAGAKIVVADEQVRLDDSTPPNVVRDPAGTSMVKLLTGSELAAQALVGVEPGGTIEVKGVKITAYPAQHSSSNASDSFSATPTDWFYVEVSGFGVLHTGDGMFTDSKPDLSGKRVDLYIVHYVDGIYAEDYYKLVPQSRILVPLHLHELGHGKEILNYAMFWNALEQERGGHLWLEHVTPQNTGVSYAPMIWGESLDLSLNP